MTDLKTHLIRQMVFSKGTFGPGNRALGILDHMEKELKEVRDELHHEEQGVPADEWVDLVILALDGLTRQLWYAGDYQMRADEIAEVAVKMIVGKQARNERRVWPDWRTADPDKAIEHDRSKEHEWRKSAVNHGTQQCWKCLMTYEEWVALGKPGCEGFGG